jgi:hypothetical protein
MTAARQTPKRQHPATIAVLVAIHVAILIAILVLLPAAKALATERIVVDWHTGLAIGGYDPVAFYTEGKPLPGNPDIEYQYAGAVWRFRNIGNREAFAARPDVYMPQFGGYDPVGVARGVAVAGNPSIWLIAGQRLFLFYDRDRLSAFAAEPQRVISAAEHKWPQLLRTLSP